MTAEASARDREGQGPTRVVLVDDSALFRQGLASLLTLSGLVVVAELSSPSALPAVLELHRPHVVLLDVRMAPTFSDEGIRAAVELRSSHPEVAVLVLSTYAEGAWARQLFMGGSDGLGYLLKDRVNDVSALVDAIGRVRSGGAVVDPEVVSQLVSVTNRRSRLAQLSEREREVLTLMAEGYSNVGIGKALYLSPRTVEAHIAAVFDKLPLSSRDNITNRRVLAVLAYLQEHPPAG